MGVMVHRRRSYTDRYALLASLFLSLAACSGPQSPLPEAVVPVTVATAAKKPIPDIVNAVGTVEPINSVSLKSRVDGQIFHALVKDGDEVKANQLLLKIDPRPFQAQLEQARAAQARDQAQLAQARREEKRYAELAKRGLVSQEQYQQQTTALSVAEAAMKLDAANIDGAQLNLDYTDIRAPISGRIGRILVQPGNLVKANDTQALLTLNQMAPIYVNFSILGKLVDRVRKMQEQGPLIVHAAQIGDAGAVEGAVAFIDNAIDAATGTVKVRAIFPNVDQKLWPGQLVNAMLVLGRDEDSVVVPEAAVKTGPDGSYVFIVKGNGKVEQRNVKVSRSYAGEAVIQAGVGTGETVVIDGQSRLVDSSSVRVSGAEQ